MCLFTCLCVFLCVHFTNRAAALVFPPLQQRVASGRHANEPGGPAMTPQHQVGVSGALGWSRCVQTCVCGLHTGLRVCAPCEARGGSLCTGFVHQRGVGGGGQHLTLKKKVGKQDATLTQETGAIGDCLHCYPINRP